MKRLLVSAVLLWSGVAGPAQARTPQQTAKLAITWAFCGHRYSRCEAGEQAKRVSWCESRWNIWARNGEYLGLFQMGSRERRRYGHGNNAWAQSAAAHRYWLAVRRRWTPTWTCGWAA
ncbi:MAG TPA: hypothetical protein VE596_18235 [Gaiellaceae bacterium]|nr:hypothetical protein [Gaiellaceae bacterium]